MEFEFNRFKKVLDSVGQSDYHDITQYTSKIFLTRTVLCRKKTIIDRPIWYINWKEQQGSLYDIGLNYSVVAKGGQGVVPP